MTAVRAAAVPGDDTPRLHVESVGRGSPLVLLHGFALHGGLFAPLLPALVKRHRVHVVDLPAAELLCLPGAGHLPFLPHPDACRDALLAFLADD